MKPDGIVGSETASSLGMEELFGIGSEAEEELLAIGSEGEKVSQLQTELNGAWGYNIKVDGIFGPETRATVIDFQESQGLNPDGIVGPLTKQKLKITPKPTPKPSLN